MTLFVFRILLISHVFFSRAQNLSCTSNSNDLGAFAQSLEPGAVPQCNFNSSSPNCCNWVGVTCESSSSLGFGLQIKDSCPKRNWVEMNEILSRIIVNRLWRTTYSLTRFLGFIYLTPQDIHTYTYANRKGARLGGIIGASIKEVHASGKVKKEDVCRGGVVRAAMPHVGCNGSEIKLEDNVVMLIY